MSFSHWDEAGRARMVDIGRKPLVRRSAVAEARLRTRPETIRAVRELAVPKGDPVEVARLAGIQAAKETARLIPLCHPLLLDWVDVSIELETDGFRIRSEVTCRWATGVEMEALTAATISALTLYDMCKAIDSGMVLEGVRLIEKRKEPFAENSSLPGASE
ncbi:MAG: cyclic pyranopterin monophosphate synthase MoaC [Acidobacteriota bacterium]